MSISSHTRNCLLLFICLAINVCASSPKLASVVRSQQSDEIASIFKRATNDATCPVDPTVIAPCTCSLNKTSKNGLPELSCINFNGGGDLIPLEQIFKNLTDYLNVNDDAKEYERLLLVNSQARTLNQTLFNGLQFRYLSVYETNLTQVDNASFTQMADTLTYLLIKGDRLSVIFPALSPLQKLNTLIFNLGLYSFKVIPSNALAALPELQKVTMNGVANTIRKNAFVNLPKVQLIKVTNQLETIESGAFAIKPETIQDSGLNTTRATTTAQMVTIDLSNNKLDENSFGFGFIELNPDLNITLDLTYNWIKFLPEDIFLPFFQANQDNQLILMNNKFECGLCNSYWIIRNSSLIRGRLTVNCYMNNQLPIWDYDWSHCVSGSNGGSSNLPKFSAVMFALVIQLLLVLFVRR